MPSKQISKPSDFKKKSLRQGTEVELPSGNVVRVRTPGLPTLLAEGVIPDSLTPLVQAAIEGQSGTESNTAANAMEALGGGLTAIGKMLDVMSLITSVCVIEPKCAYHKREKRAGQGDQIQESYTPEMEVIPDEARDEEILYTDDMDEEDKSFIFQLVVGGTRDLAKFRETTAAVAGVSAG